MPNNPNPNDRTQQGESQDTTQRGSSEEKIQAPGKGIDQQGQAGRGVGENKPGQKGQEGQQDQQGSRMKDDDEDADQCD
jgi:hypothetical protein